MRASDGERQRVLDYFVSQRPGDPVAHLEKVAVARVGTVLHDIWDVHCRSSRWWAISNSLNLYSQEDFKSRDVALTFHVGLMVRIASRKRLPISEEAAGLLPGMAAVGAGRRVTRPWPGGRGLPGSGGAAA